jgi:hypothetical protein
LFGNIISRRYWVNDKTLVAILGDKSDVAAYCHKYPVAMKAKDFRLIAASGDSLKDYKVIIFQRMMEVNKVDIFVNHRTSQTRKAKTKEITFHIDF